MVMSPHSVISGCCWWGRGFCFWQDPVDGDGLLHAKSRYKTMAILCLRTAYLPCDISLLFSVSAALFHPLAPLPLSFLSLSPSLSSSGLIRAGL